MSRISRSWDSICIECLDVPHFKEVTKLFIYLKLPFALLGIAKQIILRVPRDLDQTYSIQVLANGDLFN